MRPIKIGVSLRRDIDLNTAFSDYESGYAFLTTGHLRHGDNRQGTVFGKSCGPKDVVGCCLNLSKGTLSYSINGTYMGRSHNFSLGESVCLYTI